MLRKILRYLLIAVALLMGIGLLLPGKTHFERQIDIAAPANVVYNQVNELKNWPAWSPWYALDPTAKMVYSSPASAGLGAWYTWDGDKKTVGSGKLTILEADSSKLVRCKMNFGDNSESFADFKLTATDSTSTKVTWSFDTDHGFNPPARWFGLVLEKFLSPDFEKGLAKLKTVCETGK
jgi:hypothetical protein